MKEYICTVCGYVHKTEGELPEDFVCPVCGAGRDAFKLKEDAPGEGAPLEKPRLERELSSMEMSVICSNLARGCEKQYMPEQSEEFKKLAEFFAAKAEPQGAAGVEELLQLIGEDISSGFPYGSAAAKQGSDRGALRSLVWAEKVTRMLQSLLNRYRAEGERMLENTGVFVCSVCGFVFVGDTPPEICPVCKVPAWKFQRVEGGAK